MQRDVYGIENAPEVHRLQLLPNDNGTSWLVGPTYDIRLFLREEGGVWCADEKRWLMPVGFDEERLVTIVRLNRERTDALFHQREIVDDDGNPMVIPPQLKLIRNCNSYKMRDEIKQAGGRWDPDRKGWVVPVAFDESIIPQDDRQRDDEGNVVRRKPKCSICGSEDHKKNTCPCEICGIVGRHSTNNCPTRDPRYMSSGHPDCLCNCTRVCEKCAGAAHTE